MSDGRSYVGVSNYLFKENGESLDESAGVLASTPFYVRIANAPVGILRADFEELEQYEKKSFLEVCFLLRGEFDTRVVSGGFSLPNFDRLVTFLNSDDLEPTTPLYPVFEKGKIVLTTQRPDDKMIPATTTTLNNKILKGETVALWSKMIYWELDRYRAGIWDKAEFDWSNYIIVE